MRGERGTGVAPQRIRRIALRINVNHENAEIRFRHEPGQMHSKRRLADPALLIVDDNGLHLKVRNGSNSAGAMSLSPCPSCPGGCWFEPTDDCESGHRNDSGIHPANPLPEESGRPIAIEE